MAEEPVGCAKPTGAVIGEDAASPDKSMDKPKEGESTMVMARVGGKAPDFQAPAYHKGKFITIKLSGDFTFV